VAKSINAARGKLGNAGGSKAGQTISNGADTPSDTGVLDNEAHNLANYQKLKDKILADEISQGHAYGKHVATGEFESLGVTTRAEYQAFLENRLQNITDIRHPGDGRLIYVDHETRTVIIKNPTSGESTAFRPDFGVGWDKYMSQLPKK
jgi:hypothetical protein